MDWVDDVDEILTNDIEHDISENALERGDQHKGRRGDQDHRSVQAATIHPSMTPQERTWWAMSFEELYQHARSNNFGKKGRKGESLGESASLGGSAREKVSYLSRPESRGPLCVPREQYPTQKPFYAHLTCSATLDR